MVSGNGYAIKNLKSGKVIDVVAASTANGAAVQQWDINGSPAQLWDIQIADGGGLVFVNLNSGKALNVASNNSVNQANLDLSAASQRWTLEVTQGLRLDRPGRHLVLLLLRRHVPGLHGRRLQRLPVDQGLDQRDQLPHLHRQHQLPHGHLPGICRQLEPIKDWICSVGTTNPHDPPSASPPAASSKFSARARSWATTRTTTTGPSSSSPAGAPTARVSASTPRDTTAATGFPGVQYDTTIGRPETHGCVRLWFDEAKWIYDYIPLGTKVYSY